MRLTADDILRRIREDLKDAGWWSDDLLNVRFEWMTKVIELLKPRAKKVSEFVPQMRAFFAATPGELLFDEVAVAKHLSDPAVLELCKAFAAKIQEPEPFDAATLEAALRALAVERGVKAGVLIHATRVLVTGQGNSPGLFEVLELVGRDRVVDRLIAGRAAL